MRHEALCALLLLLLCTSSSLVSGAAAAAAAGKEPGAGPRPQQHSSVPGQAFHDWRTALIAANYSSSNTQWVHIVAMREQLSKLEGPGAATASHPAAARRLRIARALLARASADADTAAAAAAAAARGGGDASQAAQGSSFHTPLPKAPGEQQQQQQPHTNDHRGRTLQLDADPAKQQQQHQAAREVSIQPGAAAASSMSNDTLSSGSGSSRTTAATSSTPTIPVGGSSSQAAGSTEGMLLPGVQQSISGRTDVELMAQLTARMRQQPYKPLKTEGALLESTLMQFVRRGPQGRLYVQGGPWLLKGMDVPEALQMAGGGPVQQSQLLYLIDRAQTLGLNTLRFRLFADGAPGVGSAASDPDDVEGADGSGFPAVALQPAPGVLNGTLLRDGLEWLLHECSLRGIRLLPVLTNGGSAEGGGMKAYVDWADSALTITEFYSNDTIKSVFLDNVAAMLGHVNSLTGLPLREDPVILGWQLAEEASHPGGPSSQTLLAWLRQLGVFIKERAPHQLLISGVMDLFGHNSPHHLHLNPYTQVFSPASSTPHHYEPRCHGVDFWLHNQLPEMDAALSGVLPDMHLACNATCKLDFTREWIRAHLRDALRMRKPLILGGIGALRPHSWRLQVLRLVHEELQRALQRGHPIGGFILSGLSHPDMQDSSGWATFYTSKGVHKEPAPLHNLNMQAVADVKWWRFMNYDAFLACSAAQTRGTSNDRGEASNTQGWVDGWEDVVRAVAAISKLPADGASLAH